MEIGKTDNCFKNIFSWSDWLFKVSKQFHDVPLLAACVFLLTKQAFKLSLKYFQKIIKQLMNSVQVGYEELLGPRSVLDTTNFCLNNSSYPARPHSKIV